MMMVHGADRNSKLSEGITKNGEMIMFPIFMLLALVLCGESSSGQEFQIIIKGKAIRVHGDMVARLDGIRPDDERYEIPGLLDYLVDHRGVWYSDAEWNSDTLLRPRRFAICVEEEATINLLYRLSVTMAIAGLDPDPWIVGKDTVHFDFFHDWSSLALNEARNASRKASNKTELQKQGLNKDERAITAKTAAKKRQARTDGASGYHFTLIDTNTVTCFDITDSSGILSFQKISKEGHTGSEEKNVIQFSDQAPASLFSKSLTAHAAHLHLEPAHRIQLSDSVYFNNRALTGLRDSGSQPQFIAPIMDILDRRMQAEAALENQFGVTMNKSVLIQCDPRLPSIVLFECTATVLRLGGEAWLLDSVGVLPVKRPRWGGIPGVYKGPEEFDVKKRGDNWVVSTRQDMSTVAASAEVSSYVRHHPGVYYVHASVDQSAGDALALVRMVYEAGGEVRLDWEIKE